MLLYKYNTIPVEGGLSVVFNFVVALVVGGDGVVVSRVVVVVVDLCVVLTGLFVVSGPVPSVGAKKSTVIIKYVVFLLQLL